MASRPVTIRESDDSSGPERQVPRVVAEGATVSALWRAHVERYPPLGTLAYRPLVACDMGYSSWERELAGVREVAFLPPVSGG